MMFGSGTRQMVDTFAAQFESDDRQGYLYRRYGRGAGIPVSAAERDAFVADYRRGIRWWFVGFGGATVFAILVLTFIGLRFDLDARLPAYTMPILVVVLLTVAIMATVRRAYDAPRRALEARAPVGPERSDEEAKAIAIARQSWWQIFGVFAGMLLLVGEQALGHDVLHGWGRLWLLLLAFGVAATSYAAVRKWQHQVG